MQAALLHPNMDINLISAVRLAFLGAALAVLLVSLIPPLRTRFLAYGPRGTGPRKEEIRKNGVATLATKDGTLVSEALDYLASLQVPRDYFSSFYAVSLACLTFWPIFLLTNPAAVQTIAAHAPAPSGTMTARQVVLAWALLCVQATRRLWECHTLPSSPHSKMWVGHWIMGILFYFGTSVAVWIEGVPALLNYNPTIHDLVFGNLDLRTYLSTTLFILASGLQYDCHAYLASLQSTTTSSKPTPNSASKPTENATHYVLPVHPAFTHLIAPHYTAECVIYLSVAVFAAAPGAWVNGTLACALVFVVVNLGVTAAGTKKWYEARFGTNAVRGKWRMLPGIW